jgi:RHS repeat-associated protein
MTLTSPLKSAHGRNYAYDGDGHRVSKSSSKLYWYGSGGDILAETDTSGNTTAEYVFFGGQRVAMLPSGSNPVYYVEDMLGTSRVIPQNNGVVCYDADFYPYGGERAYTNTCQQNYKFEGKERDSETGNDDFGARYYSNRFGRWLSSETLNLYAMVADDPESFADLDGHYVNGADVPLNNADLQARESGSNSGGTNFSAGMYSGDHDDVVSSDPSAAQAQEQTPQSLTGQIPSGVRAQMATAIKDSNSPTADDKKGRFHEEYGVAGLNASGGWVVSRDKPGPYANPDTADHVSPSGKAANQ